MPRKENSYDLSNFFLNRNKVIFYIRLQELKKRKIKFYNLCKENRISLHHGQLILSGFKESNLITFRYDNEFFSYVVSYTEQGKKLRDKLVDLKKLMEVLKIW